MGSEPPDVRLLERLDRVDRLASDMLPSEQSRALVHFLDDFQKWRESRDPVERSKQQRHAGGGKGRAQMDVGTLISFATLKYSVDQYKRRNENPQRYAQLKD